MGKSKVATVLYTIGGGIYGIFISGFMFYQAFTFGLPAVWQPAAIKVYMVSGFLFGITMAILGRIACLTAYIKDIQANKSE